MASPAYLARAGTPSSIEDLSRHACIAMMSRDVPRPWPFAAPHGDVEHVPMRPVRSNDAEYVRAAVLAGLGIGHNAGWLYARDVEAGLLVPLLETFRPAPFPISAVWPGRPGLPARTRVFVARVRRLPRGDLRGGSAPRDPLACRAGIRAMPAGPLPATSSRVYRCLKAAHGMVPAPSTSIRQEQDMVDENGPHYFVAFQTPGPKWVPGVKYNEQPEFGVHVAYMIEMHDKGLTVMSGPFMKEAGGLSGVLDDGGMTIFKAKDLAEATRIATDDPTVKSGFLNVEVKMMWVPFH
ncbi:uncharacterized protein YciI [Cupriavidus plantarum]|nr:uncharacterized protein YciI [Cupriavidus plantarum]